MVRTRASSSDASFTSWPALPDPQEGNGTTVKIQYKAKIRWDKKDTSKSKVNGERPQQSGGGKSISEDKIEKVFKCPVCLTLPACDIYQCNEGHIICMDCYNKLKTKSPILCPTCRTTMPGVPIRNRVAEQVKR